VQNLGKCYVMYRYRVLLPSSPDKLDNGVVSYSCYVLRHIPCHFVLDS